MRLGQGGAVPRASLPMLCKNGIGSLVGIDPIIKNFRVGNSELHGRYTLIQGCSSEAVRCLGGQLDFVFIDALHIYDAVMSDFTGILPQLALGAHVQFQDTYHQRVDPAIRKVVAEKSDLVDCGFITWNAHINVSDIGQGLRLVRKGAVESKRMISEAYERNDVAPPPFTNGVWNYDSYYNRVMVQNVKGRVADRSSSPGADQDT